MREKVQCLNKPLKPKNSVIINVCYHIFRIFPLCLRNYRSDRKKTDSRFRVCIIKCILYKKKGRTIKSQSHNTKQREHVCLPMKRIFPAFKFRPQTPPIDKGELGDTAIIPGKCRMHTSPSGPHPPNQSHWPMSALSRVTSRCVGAHSGRENLHQFLPILL